MKKKLSFVQLWLLFPLLLFSQVDNPFSLTFTGYFPVDTLEEWDGGPSYYSQWENGISSDSTFFPIAVWLQDPKNSTTANKFKNIGINTHIGLWEGPTESQLQAVTQLGSTTLCSQNSTGLNSANNRCIKAWIQDDEPDNAQNGTQTPVSSSDIIAKYNQMKNADPTRPIYLNLGQGVACDDWYGRGDSTDHPEQYYNYAKGGDILSFDTYPMNVFPLADDAAPWFKIFNNIVAGDITYVGRGIDRLRKFSEYKKPVWTWIECTNINGDSRYSMTPVHLKAEVWMAIIHGARGIGYFCHQFVPEFIEAGLLANSEMTNMADQVNHTILELATVLNTPTVSNGCSMILSDTSIHVDKMIKRSGNNTWLFATATKAGNTEATFFLNGFSGSNRIEVFGENRNLSSSDGCFKDNFSNFDVHIYKISNQQVGSASFTNNQSCQLKQNYPNPFNQSSIIEYFLPEQEKITLKIYNLSGKEIATLVEGTQNAGTHLIRVNRHILNDNPGIYIYRLSADKYQFVKMLSFLK